MTPKERARKIVKELEVDGRKREMPRLSFDEVEDQIECAIFAAVLAEQQKHAELETQVKDMPRLIGEQNGRLSRERDAAVRRANNALDTLERIENAAIEKGFESLPYIIAEAQTALEGRITPARK